MDTDILIEHKRAKKEEKNKTKFYLLASKGHQFAVTSISAYELLRGDDSNEDIFWNDFFSRVMRVDFDFHAGVIAAEIYRDLKKRGMLIETKDLLIASIALKHKLKLATNNKKDFGRISGLELI